VSLIALIVTGSPGKRENVPGLIRMDYGFAPNLGSAIQVYLWQSKAIADRFFNSEWDGATSRRWESARMAREDYEAPLMIEGARIVEGAGA